MQRSNSRLLIIAQCRGLAFLGVLSALLLTFGTVQARRSTFVQAIIITASATPAPTGDAKWQQVPDRGKVDRVLQHPTPSFRNLWLPVRFDDGLFAADTMSVVRYYRNMGFLDARIVASAKEPVSTATGGMQYVNLLIVVGGISPLERYRVSSLSFSGKMSLDSVALGKAFRNRHTGGYFSPAAMAENYVALRTAYADAGYFDSSAVAIRQRPIIDLERRTVSERYEIQERTPTSVSGVRIINGDAPRSLKTDSAVIVQALSDAHLVDGEVFGRQRILNAESYLFDLGVFRRARAFPDTGYVGGSPFLRRVAVDLSERDAGEARIQMGYSNIQRWRLSETMTYSNFLGEAKLVGQEGQLAQDIQSFSLLYGQPRVGFPSFTPGIGGKSARVRFDQVLSSSWEVLAAGDTARTLAWKAGLSRRFGRMARVGFSYDLSRTDTTASYVFGLSRGGATVQSALSVSVLYDTRDEFLNPTRGFAFNAQVRFVNPNYRVTRMSVRPEALVVYFYPYSRFVVGAVSASGGFYYVGKEDSLNQAEQFWRSRQTPTARGIPRDDLTVIRGDTVGNPAVAYALIKAETRIAIWKRLSSAVFVDAGQAWVWIPRAVTDPTAEERSSRGWSAMEAGKFGLSAGFGPRVDWGLLFRLDIVRQITPSSNWTYEFGITQAF